MTAASIGPSVTLVVAMARNRVIGRDNTLPWRLPEDLKHFKAVTLGKPVLMGRKTYESIGKPLPGRTNLILTRAKDWHAPGTHTVHSIAAALAAAEVRQGADGATELCSIGGAEVFELTLPLATRIHLTRVEADIEGDALFPALDLGEWRETSSRRLAADAKNAYDMTFVTLDRVQPAAP